MHSSGHAPPLCHFFFFSRVYLLLLQEAPRPKKMAGGLVKKRGRHAIASSFDCQTSHVTRHTSHVTNQT